MPAPEQIGFAHLGIASVLETQRLRVPVNQREYSWEQEHVTDLFSDLLNGLAGNGSYFLGTIVLTSGDEVSDGQQRLATTMIMLVAIRDWLLSHGDETRAKGIEDRFLFQVDLKTTDIVAKLSLNVDDDTFFRQRVLARPKVRPAGEAVRESHRRLVEAYRVACERVEAFVGGYDAAHQTARLIEWVDYLQKQALVIVLSVPDHLNAFVMFETLNDRGLKASQADLIKNHLLSHAKERTQEAQQLWARMLGTLDTIQPDLTVTFLHHYLITTEGPTKEREVFDRVRKITSSTATALDFLSKVANAAIDYAALYNPDHDKWNEYDTSVRKSIVTINRDLRVEQIRPLMFAVARTFSPKEAALAFRAFVSWSVRFLVVGGRGGFLDRNYAVLAAQVGTKKIATAKDLEAAAVKDIVPNDAEFEAGFASALVSQSHLARYYLRALEKKRKGEPEPEWVPSDDAKAINLEHVLPENPGTLWPDISKDDALAYYKRIGNLAILQASKNSKMGNQGFSHKKPVLAASAYYWTSEIGKATMWGPQEIEERQKQLARAAVETWPLRLVL
jgi:hypothetical protein